MNKTAIQCYLMMLTVIAGIAVPVQAAPPEISDAELKALHAQYLEEMSKQNEREQLRDKKSQTQRQGRRLHQYQQSALRDIMENVEADSLARQAKRTDFKLDITSVDMTLASLGMMPSQDNPAEGAADSPKRDLAADATNPVAPLIQLQFKNVFVGESNAGDGYSNTFVIQPVIPWKIGEQAILSRFTLPLIATADLGGSIGREYGVGDLVLLNAFTSTIDKGGPGQAMIGPIFTTTLPTATSDFVGEGKYQAGPGFIYINTANKDLQWGILAYQQWSFADAGGDDDRRDVNKLFFQPIITKHFEGGWYISAQDILWSVDFEDNNRWSLTAGVRIGRITKLGEQPVNIFVEPFYDVSGNNNGNEWGVKLSISFLFPTS